MKKVIPAVIVLVAIAAVAFVFFKRAVVHHVKATELVPAETIFFAQLPDLRRTAERWPKTALAQIGEEPEVKAFLAKPRATAPQMKLWDEKIAQLYRVAPGEAFIAVTSIEGNEPRFIAGFSFSGRKADVNALLAEPRAEMKSNWPAGKSDVTMQGRTEIETFTYQDTTIGEAFVEDWYFVSNDMELLRHTIDIAEQGLGAKGIGASDLYRKSTARLPADGEVVVFAQLGNITDRIVSLLTASGQAPDPKQLAEIKKYQAIAWGTKFENALMRDTLFILSPGGTAEPPLAQRTLALSDPNTFLVYSSALPGDDRYCRIPRWACSARCCPAYGAFEKGLADKGLKLSDFNQAFGPEFGLLVDWGQGAPQPSTLLAMDVQDAALAKRFADAFTGDSPGSAPWGREDKDGSTIYQSPPAQGLFSFSPTVALTDHFLVIGFSQPEVLAGLAQVKGGKAAIAASPAFAEATKAVGTPTSGFGYLDLKALVERSYGTMRPFLAMTLAFAPDSAKYVDAGKLPGTDAISKHLSPAVYSQSVTADGTLVESVGPLTFNQVIGVSIGGVLAAALPAIENAFSGGLKLDPNLLQLAQPPASSTCQPAASSRRQTRLPPSLLFRPKNRPSPAPIRPAAISKNCGKAKISFVKWNECARIPVLCLFTRKPLSPVGFLIW